MKSIRDTMIFYSAALVIAIALVVGFCLLSNMHRMEDFCIESMSKARMTGYDDSVKFQVQNVISLLNGLYNREIGGEFTEREAKQEAISLIKSLRYGKDSGGYFWIDALDYTLVAHPILPQNEGQNRFTLKDKNGVMIIQKILKTVQAEKNGGFSEFYFTKADGVTVAPKRTYSILFEPWGWAVSSGNYYDDINHEISMLEQALNRRYVHAATVMIVICSLLLFLALAAAVLFSRTFTAPIIHVADFLQKMNHGDLTLRLPDTSSQNEIGRMQTQFNSFAERLYHIIHSVREKASDLEASAQGLDSKTETISSGLHEILENLQELAAHADEQTQSTCETSEIMQQITGMTVLLNQKIEGQSADVVQSSAAVEEMAANIDSIASSVTQFGNSFETLLRSSADGSGIMHNVISLVQNVSNASNELQGTNRVIADVASQTNLLAMNAAIEAAHAGESGRGFAVVAEEIQKLSEDTTKQSQVIGNTLKKVMEHITLVVDASAKADSVFSEITGQISSVDHLVQEIRNAITEQSEGSRQITCALTHIKEITEEIRKDSNEIDSGAGSVVTEIGKLKKLAGAFQESTARIADATRVIEQNVAAVNQMAGQNRQFAGELTSHTQAFKL